MALSLFLTHMYDRAMCLGIPGQVTDILDEHYATVDVGGARRKINTDLLAGRSLGNGDWVLIHVGFALAVIDEEEARTTLALLVEMEEVYLQELQALAESKAHRMPTAKDQL